MSRRPVTYLATLLLVIASVAFTVGSYNAQRHAARQAAASDAKIAALRSELIESISAIRRGQAPPVAGTAGHDGRFAGLQTEGGNRAIVNEIKRELQDEMGLLPLRLLRDRRESFVELYSYDNLGASNYGTAGYLGDGYFVTVKHGVVALGRDASSSRDNRRVVSIKVMHRGKALRASLVDSGDAEVEVDSGDWAIIKVDDPVDIPPLRLDLDFPYDFAEPIFRLGNDYSKGIILSTGYVGQRTSNGLVTCLTDGHPGVSGGGVLDQRGNLVGIPIGRMQGDYRFSFILPLRREMFRKLPGIIATPDPERVVTD
jgi:hypothetical protein